jgi:DNA-binding transcriptional regulator YhcF (GntR family)
VKIAPSGGSKYRQIFQNLLNGINSGAYAPGQRLPSESELVKAHGTSRITVNRALRELQLGGFIDRRVGSGSFVREKASGYTFGLIIADLGRTEIFEPICRGMAKAQEIDGHHALLWGPSLGDDEGNETQALNLCRQLVAKVLSL